MRPGAAGTDGVVLWIFVRTGAGQVYSGDRIDHMLQLTEWREKRTLQAAQSTKRALIITRAGSDWSSVGALTVNKHSSDS